MRMAGNNNKFPSGKEMEERNGKKMRRAKGGGGKKETLSVECEMVWILNRIRTNICDICAIGHCACTIGMSDIEYSIDIAINEVY